MTTSTPHQHPTTTKENHHPMKLIIAALIGLAALTGCGTTSTQPDTTPTSTTRWIDSIYVTPPTCPKTVCK